MSAPAKILETTENEASAPEIAQTIPPRECSCTQRGGRGDSTAVMDEETGLPVWIDGTLRSVKISLDTVEVGRAFWNGLGLEATQRGPSVWEVEGAGGLVYVASLEQYSGRICVEPLGFTWDLFSEETDPGALEK